MNLRLTLLGALAVGLVSTAAYAVAPDSTAPGSGTGASPSTSQPADPNDTGTMPSQTGMPAGTGAAPDTSMPADTTPPPAPTAADTSAPPAATGAAVNTSSTTDPTTGAVHTTIASSPVPDTPENRRLYGGPMSHAGRHTHAQGN